MARRDLSRVIFRRSWKAGLGRRRRGTAGGRVSRIEALEDRRLMAGGGSWASDASGDWSDASKWAGGIIAFGSGNTATFNLDITATRTVTLDTGRVIGNLEFGDTTPSNTWVLADKGQVLTLNPATSSVTPPLIEVINTAATIQTTVGGTKGFTVQRGGSAGQLTLSGNNTYTGLTTVGVSGTSVTLRIEHNNALGASGSADKTVVTNTSRVQLAGNVITPESFDIVGTGTSGAINNSAGSNTVGGLVTLTGDASVGGGAGVGNLLRLRGGVETAGFLFTVSGTGDFKVDSAPIAGSGGLAKGGSGKLTLADVNTFSGLTTISGGTLEVQNHTALGSTANGVLVSAGTLALSGHVTITDEALTLNGVGLGNGGALRNLGGNNKWAGQVTLGSLSQINADAGSLTLDVASGAAIVAVDQGVIFGGVAPIHVADPIATGTGTLEKRDAGTLTLTAASTYTGTTTVAGGTLQLGNGTGGGALAPAGAIAIQSGATLAVNRSNTATQGTDFSAAPITGQGGVSQIGAGTLILTAANEYQGPTAVTAGRLLVDGDQTLATGAVTVAAGATLGGSGAMGGAVTVGGTLAPGGATAIESLASGALTLEAGSTFAFTAVDATATGADLMVVNGGLSFAGAATLDLSGADLAGAGWVPGDKLTLISYSGAAVTGGFTGYADGAIYTFGTNLWRFDYDDATAGANYATEAVGERFVTLSMVAGQTITFAELGTKVYGDDPFLIAASSDSGLTLSFVSSDPTVASVSGATVTILRAGTTTITASQAGDALHAPAADVARVLVVSPKTLTVTVDGQSKVYGDADPALTYGVSGLVGGDTVSGALARDAGENVGIYAITQGTLDAGPNYSLSFTGKDLLITPKPVGVTADAASKTYGDADPAFTYAVNGLVGSDTGTGALVRAAGENVGTYAIGLGTLDFGPNYTVGFTGADLAITAKALTVGGLTAANKNYDGTVTAPVTGTAGLVGVVAGDTVGLAGTVTWAFPSVNVGAATLVRTGSYSLTNDPAGNYTLVQPSLAATINHRPVTVTGVTATNRVYDATTVVKVSATAAKFGAVAGVTASGVLTADASGVSLVAPSPAGAVASKSAGTKTVTVTGLSLAGAKSGNYVIQTVAGPSVTISKAPLSVTGLAALDKPYDGTTTGAFDKTAAALVGVIAGDAISLGTVTGKFAGVNVGTYAVTATVALLGVDVANYALTTPTGFTASITAKNLTITGLTAANRIYDGTTNVVVSGTAKYSGLAAVDAVKFATPTLSGARTAAFADKHAGTAKPVAVDGYVAPSSNYTLTPLVLKANITPKAITLTGVTAVNRTYDGTKLVGITGGTLGGTIAGDSVAAAPETAVGTMADKKAGLAKAVTVTGYSLAGSDAGNYTFPQPVGLKVNISQKPLAVTGVAAVNRVYDGTTIGSLSGTPLPDSAALVAGDVVTVGGVAKIAFADVNVGTGKPVTVTGYTLAGLDAPNYLVQQPTGLAADITPRALTITGLAASSRIYDGTTNVAITGTAKYGNLATVDAVKFATPTLSGARTAAFADKTVGTAKPVAVNGYVAPSANYTLAPLVLAANITRKALTLTGVVAAGRTYDGTTAIKITGGAFPAGAVVAGDTVVLDTSAVAGSVATKNVGVSKPVAVTGFAISGTDSGNYSLAQPTTLKATITARSIGVTGLAGVDREYDATTVAQASGSAALVAASLVAGDDLSLVTAGAKYAFASSAVGVAKAITASGFTLSGADAGNYAVVQPVGLKATVTQATITVTGPTHVLTRDAVTGTVVIPTLAATISGLKGTDTVSGAPVLTTTATATSPVGIYAVKVTLGTLKASTNYKFAFIDGSIEIQ